MFLLFFSPYLATGMSFSLQSRDIIADSIETVMGGQWYDANIAIPGCDKNMPGCLIAMGRVNRPSIMVREREPLIVTLSLASMSCSAIGLTPLWRLERRDKTRREGVTTTPATATAWLGQDIIGVLLFHGYLQCKELCGTERNLTLPVYGW